MSVTVADVIDVLIDESPLNGSKSRFTDINDSASNGSPMFNVVAVASAANTDADDEDTPDDAASASLITDASKEEVGDEDVAANPCDASRDFDAVIDDSWRTEFF